MYGVIQQSSSIAAQIVRIAQTGYVAQRAFVQPNSQLGAWMDESEDIQWDSLIYLTLEDAIAFASDGENGAVNITINCGMDAMQPPKLEYSNLSVSRIRRGIHFEATIHQWTKWAKPNRQGRVGEQIVAAQGKVARLLALQHLASVGVITPDEQKKYPEKPLPAYVAMWELEKFTLLVE